MSAPTKLTTPKRKVPVPKSPSTPGPATPVVKSAKKSTPNKRRKLGLAWINEDHEKGSDKENTCTPQRYRNPDQYDDEIDDLASRNFEIMLKHTRRIVTYEDDEELLLKVKAKLFLFKRGQDESECGRWVELGPGCIKFLKHLEEGITYGTVRMTMSRDGTLKCLFNLLVTPEIKVERMNDKKKRICYCWTAHDENAECMVTYCLRFHNDEDAMEWKDMFAKAATFTRRAQLGLDQPNTSYGDYASEMLAGLSASEKQAESPDAQKSE